MNEKEDRWSELERRALAQPNNVTTVLSSTLRELIDVARANVNPGSTRLREINAKAKDVRAFEVTISQTVEVDSKIVICGNCGVVAPDPPASVLAAAALEYVKGSSAGKRPLIEAGNFHYGKWSPDGWTAAQHFRGAMICPECTELVVTALAKRRKPVVEAPPPEPPEQHVVHMMKFSAGPLTDGTSFKGLRCERCHQRVAPGQVPTGPCVPPTEST